MTAVRLWLIACLALGFAAPAAASSEANHMIAQIIVADIRELSGDGAATRTRDGWVGTMMYVADSVYSRLIPLTDEDRDKMLYIFESEFTVFEDRLHDHLALYMASRLSYDELEAIAFLIKGSKNPYASARHQAGIESKIAGIEQGLVAVGREHGFRLGVEAGFAAHNQVKVYLEGKYGDLGIEAAPGPTQ